MSVSLVARQEGVAASLLFLWRKLERQGALTAVSSGEAVVPASELAASRAKIAKLQRVLGKKTLENEILKAAVEYAAEKKWIARSHICSLRSRPEAWIDGCAGRTPVRDEEVLAQVREHIAQLPSYGYRRACSLLNRQRTASDLSRVKHKRVYRLMARNGLLLPKALRRKQSSSLHVDKVEVPSSDHRWCSDSFEIKCDSG